MYLNFSTEAPRTRRPPPGASAPKRHEQQTCAANASPAPVHLPRSGMSHRHVPRTRRSACRRCAALSAPAQKTRALCLTPQGHVQSALKQFFAGAAMLAPPALYLLSFATPRLSLMPSAVAQSGRGVCFEGSLEASVLMLRPTAALEPQR